MLKQFICLKTSKKACLPSLKSDVYEFHLVTTTEAAGYNLGRYNIDLTIFQTIEWKSY